MATIKDVAREAGVSTGSVSRYLNGLKLRDENMRRIKDAIHKLGYRENYIAKGLKSNRSRSVGVVVNTLTDVFATSIISHLESYLEHRNYSLLLCDYRNDQDRLERKLNFLASRSIDGVVVFHVEHGVAALREMKENGVAVVAVDAPIQDLKSDAVLVDNFQASYDVTRRLIEMGHRRIGVIAGDTSRYIGNERLNGYLACMRDHGADAEGLVFTGNYTRESGYQGALELLRSRRGITALFAENYYMTLGSFQAIMDSGLTIPRDISLVGFDHFELTDIVRPRLTVVKQPVKDMGRAIGKLLIDRIEQPISRQFSTVELECELLWNQSVDAPKAQGA